MKRGFIRVLWGDHTPDHDDGWIKPSDRRQFVDDSIAIEEQNSYKFPYRVFVYGTENFEACKAKGMDCVLVDERPFVYPLQTQFWRNKLALLQYAMEEEQYDQAVYVDWDCILLNPLPADFWNIVQQKDIIQANLHQYRRRKCKWRKEDVCKTSNGGFIVMQAPDIPSLLIDAWESLDEDLKFWDEVAISVLTDELIGGWKGVDAYWDRFEPDVCNLKKKSAYSLDRIQSKNACFMHYIQSKNNRASTKVTSGYNE